MDVSNHKIQSTLIKIKSDLECMLSKMSDGCECATEIGEILSAIQNQEIDFTGVETLLEQVKDAINNIDLDTSELVNAIEALETTIVSNKVDVTEIETLLGNVITELGVVNTSITNIDLDTEAMETLLGNVVTGLTAVKTAVEALDFDTTALENAINALKTVTESIKDDTEEIVEVLGQYYDPEQTLILTETTFDLSEYSSFAYTLVGGTAEVDLNGEVIPLPLGNFIGASLNTDAKKRLNGTLKITPAEQSGVLVIALSTGKN